MTRELAGATLRMDIDAIRMEAPDMRANLVDRFRDAPDLLFALVVALVALAVAALTDGAALQRVIGG